MAANCRIIDYVSNWMAREVYAIEVAPISPVPLINHFNLTTGCDTLVNDCDVPKECQTESFFICNLQIGTVVRNVNPVNVVTIEVASQSGGTAPYTAQWTYDTSKFDYVSGQGTTRLILERKPSASGTSIFSVILSDINQCQSTLTSSITIPTAIVDCNSGGLEIGGGNFYEGIPYSGQFRLEYGSGNGQNYGGVSFASSGVEGLVMTLPAGTLETGDGSFLFSITGTPQSSGIISFPISLFGYNCNIQFTVSENLCSQPSVSYSIQSYDPDEDEYTVRILIQGASNSPEYILNYNISGVSQPSETLYGSTTFFDFQAPPEATFSGNVVGVCGVGNVSEAAPFSGLVPDTPSCSAPVGLSIDIGNYRPLDNTYAVTLNWTAITPTPLGYTVTLLNGGPAPAGVPMFTPTNSISFRLYSGASDFIFLKTNCSTGVFSIGSTTPIATPEAPTPPPPAIPTIKRLTNVSIPSSSNERLDLWLGLDSGDTKARILQGLVFGTYQSQSVEMNKGVSNGYTPTPVGFASSDIYFNAATAPQGFPIIPSAITKLDVQVDTGSGFTYDFEFIMNLPKSYTIRQDTLDYIPKYNDGVVRPVITSSGITSNSVQVNFNTNTLTYDVCSSYNMFLLSSGGGVITATPSNYSIQNYTFTGLTSGTYLAYFEMTYDACTTPNNWRTAVPLLITIP